MWTHLSNDCVVTNSTYLTDQPNSTDPVEIKSCIAILCYCNSTAVLLYFNYIFRIPVPYGPYYGSYVIYNYSGIVDIMGGWTPFTHYILLTMGEGKFISNIHL